MIKTDPLAGCFSFIDESPALAVVEAVVLSCSLAISTAPSRTPLGMGIVIGRVGSRSPRLTPTVSVLSENLCAGDGDESGSATVQSQRANILVDDDYTYCPLSTQNKSVSHV